MRARPEIAMQQVPEIEAELFGERAVEMIKAAEIGLDRGIERALGIERATRREPREQK